MTHPSSPPAPMTAERLEEIRRLYLLAPREPYHDAQPPWYVPAIADLLSDHAALTARVAELERERNEARQDRAAALRKPLTEAMKVALHNNQKYKDRAQAAEAKLETARRDALEEAANFIEAEENEPNWGQDNNRRTAHTTIKECAALIRALQTKDTTE